MTCVILQPSYVPWCGYFHQIYKSDVFIFYDDVQYDRHGWRNRNRIKAPDGPHWLTIPVHAPHNIEARIHEIKTFEAADWRRTHFETLRHHYARASFFARYRGLFEDWYSTPAPLLSDFAIRTTIDVARELGITHTQFLRSSEFQASGAKTCRLLQLLLKVNATRYLSGPAARSYLDISLLEAHGIEVEWMEYAYPEYPQLFPPFIPCLSILDLLLNTGPEASRFIWRNERKVT